jgi:hypothetical protein
MFKKLYKKIYKKKPQEKPHSTPSEKPLKYINNTQGVSVKFTDHNGKDQSHLIKHSFIYNGVKGGFFV